MRRHHSDPSDKRQYAKDAWPKQRLRNEENTEACTKLDRHIGTPFFKGRAEKTADLVMSPIAAR
eukprot:7063978-Pyramimonas_sp.AAC.1